MLITGLIWMGEGYIIKRQKGIITGSKPLKGLSFLIFFLLMFVDLDPNHPEVVIYSIGIALILILSISIYNRKYLGRFVTIYEMIPEDVVTTINQVLTDNYLNYDLTHSDLDNKRLEHYYLYQFENTNANIKITWEIPKTKESPRTIYIAFKKWSGLECGKELFEDIMVKLRENRDQRSFLKEQLPNYLLGGGAIILIVYLYVKINYFI